MHVEALTRQLRLSGQVWLARLSAEHVIEPRAVGLQLRTTGQDRSEVQPGGRIANGANLIRDMRAGVFAHLRVQLLVRVQVVQVLRDRVVVAGRAEVAGFAVLDLERDTTGPACNDRLSGVQCLGNLNLKALTSGQLQCDLRVLHQCVQN